MNCGELFEKLYELLDCECGEKARQDLEKHLKLCRPCWNRYEFERKLKERLQQSCRKITCPDTLLKKIKIILDKC